MKRSADKSFEFQYDPRNRFELQLGVLNTLVSGLFANRTYRADKVEVHPDFDPKLMASPHDVALLRLEQKVEFVQNEIGTICLPSNENYPDSDR